MQKGQVSIDLIFTLVAAFIIINSFNTLIHESYLSQDRVNAKQQLDIESDKLANFITQTQLIDDSVFRITTILGKISYLDSNKTPVQEYPDTNIYPNYLVLSINTGKEEIKSIKEFSKNLKTTIIVDNEESKGIIVITNE